MNLELYKEKCLRTWDLSKSKQDRICNAVMGLAGEAGEVAELIKKKLFHNSKVSSSKLVKELGDLQFYIAMTAYEFDINMNVILHQNIEKLKLRYPNGYNDEDSKLRKDKIIDTNDYEYTPF